MDAVLRSREREDPRTKWMDLRWQQAQEFGTENEPLKKEPQKNKKANRANWSYCTLRIIPARMGWYFQHTQQAFPSCRFVTPVLKGDVRRNPYNRTINRDELGKMRRILFQAIPNKPETFPKLSKT